MSFIRVFYLQTNCITVCVWPQRVFLCPYQTFIPLLMVLSECFSEMKHFFDCWPGNTQKQMHIDTQHYIRLFCWCHSLGFAYFINILTYFLFPYQMLCSVFVLNIWSIKIKFVRGTGMLPRIILFLTHFFFLFFVCVSFLCELFVGCHVVLF